MSHFSWRDRWPISCSGSAVSVAAPARLIDLSHAVHWCVTYCRQTVCSELRPHSRHNAGDRSTKVGHAINVFMFCVLQYKCYVHVNSKRLMLIRTSLSSSTSRINAVKITGKLDIWDKSDGWACCVASVPCSWWWVRSSQYARSCNIPSSTGRQRPVFPRCVPRSLSAYVDDAMTSHCVLPLHLHHLY